MFLFLDYYSNHNLLSLFVGSRGGYLFFSSEYTCTCIHNYNYEGVFSKITEGGSVNLHFGEFMHGVKF